MFPRPASLLRHGVIIPQGSPAVTLCVLAVPASQYNTIPRTLGGHTLSLTPVLSAKPKLKCYVLKWV